jgi:hypothetical protein
MEVGVDAYVTVAEVLTYLTARNAHTSWAAASTGDKEAAIIEATSFLDSTFNWKGTIEDTDQTLGWPRTCAYDREGRLLEDIPTPIVNATAELANLALGGRLQPMTLVSASSGVKRERIGDVEVEYDLDRISESYTYVRMILRGIGSMQTSSSAGLGLVRT